MEEAHVISILQGLVDALAELKGNLMENEMQLLEQLEVCIRWSNPRYMPDG